MTDRKTPAATSAISGRPTPASTPTQGPSEAERAHMRLAIQQGMTKADQEAQKPIRYAAKLRERYASVWQSVLDELLAAGDKGALAYQKQQDGMARARAAGKGKGAEKPKSGSAGEAAAKASTSPVEAAKPASKGQGATPAQDRPLLARMADLEAEVARLRALVTG